MPIPALKRQLTDALLARCAHMRPPTAAKVLGIDESRMSDLRHGRHERFSVERLIRMLAAAECDVSITVRPRGEEPLRWMRLLRERRERRASRAPAAPPDEVRRGV